MLFKRNKCNAENTTETTVVKPAPTAGAAEVPGKAKSHPALWKSVLVGGVPGILIGAMSRESAGKEPGPISSGEVESDVEGVVSPVGTAVEAPVEALVETVAETPLGREATVSVVNEAQSVSDEMSSPASASMDSMPDAPDRPAARASMQAATQSPELLQLSQLWAQANSPQHL